MVTLDPLLIDALFKGAPPQSARGEKMDADDETPPVRTLPTEVQIGEIKKRFVGRLEPWTRVAGGNLKKPTMRAGTAGALHDL